MNTISVSLDEIESVVRKNLLAHGAGGTSASSAVREAEAEAVGNKICGLYYVSGYCEGLKSGGIPGDVEPVVTQPKSSCISVDVKTWVLAQTAFAKGLPEAVLPVGGCKGWGLGLMVEICGNLERAAEKCSDTPGARLPGSQRTRNAPVSLDLEMWSELHTLRNSNT